MRAPDRDNAGVIAHPPLLWLAAVLIGFGIEALWPVALPGQAARIAVGFALFAAAFAVFLWAWQTFRRAGTNVQTQKPSTTVVANGPYRFTRNPIYLAMAAGTVAIGIGAGSLWVVAMAVPLVAVLQAGVIRREERYLEAKFGDAYRAYRARVRRWV